MLKHPFRLFVSMSVSLVMNWGQAQPGADNPNVLLIMIDDLRPALGAYGDARARTPNIDRLAAQGTLFANAFATVPVCGASRASLLSGRKPTTNRFLTFNSRLDEDLPEATNMPAYFKSRGYTALANGKVFDNWSDSADAWSEPVWAPMGEWTSPLQPDHRGEELQKAYLNNPDGIVGPAFERLDVNDTDYPDGKIAEKTIEDLHRFSQSESPFFLVIGLRKPHLPFNAPSRYWDFYDPADFELPATYRERSPGIPPNPFHTSGELRQYAGIPDAGPIRDDGEAINLIHGYYAAVSYVDALVGRVLDSLDTEGLSENTIVVLIGDHGFNLGEHTMWTKHTLFDLALHSPLIIKAPGKASGRVEGVASYLDVFPTLIELAGLRAADGLDGISLVPAIDDVSVSPNEAVLSRWFHGTSVRTNQYRYTEWRSEDGAVTARMLFDVLADPDETINLAELTGYSGLVQGLSEIITNDRSNSPWAELVRNRAGPQ